jgi:hypothetical protein
VALNEVYCRLGQRAQIWPPSNGASARRTVSIVTEVPVDSCFPTFGDRFVLCTSLRYSPSVDSFWTVILEAVLSGSVIAAVVTGMFKVLSDSIADHRAQIKSIWTSINAHIATEYWPLTMAAWGVSSTAEDWLKSQSRPTGRVLECFHWYAQYYALGAAMTRSKVWILLMHTDSEGCVQDLGIQLLSRPGLSSLELSTLGQSVKADATLADTSALVGNDPVAKAVYLKFSTWMTDPNSRNSVMGMVQDGRFLAELMTSEYNRMYQGWYGREFLLQNFRLRRRVNRYLYPKADQLNS